MVFKNRHPSFQQRILCSTVLLFFYLVLIFEKSEVLAMTDIEAVRAGLVTIYSHSFSVGADGLETHYVRPAQVYRYTSHEEPDVSSLRKTGLDRQKKLTASPVEPFNPYQKMPCPSFHNRLPLQQKKALAELKNLQFFADHSTPDANVFKNLELLPGYVQSNQFIDGDGNCLFRAISFYRDGNQEGHAAVRSEMVDFIKKNPELIKDALGFKYRGVEINTVQQYCDLMSIPGVWGDEYSVIALSSLYKFNIALVSETDESIFTQLSKWKPVDNHCNVNLNAQLPDDNKVHWVGLYLKGSHYELLYREPDEVGTLQH